MTKGDYKAHWKQAKEETILSCSGFHFGHYIAGIKSDYIFHFHALKATLLLFHGLVLECWVQGLFGDTPKTVWMLINNKAPCNTSYDGIRMLKQA